VVEPAYSPGIGTTTTRTKLLHPLHTRIGILLFAQAARPLRFAITGGFAGLLQLGLLAALARHGWEPWVANLTAFLLAAQVNFALSTVFTWRDRATTDGLYRRWLVFHGTISSMAVLNIGVYAIARTALPYLPSAAAGIAVAALGNFLLGDRLVFRARRAAPGDAGGTHEEP
jgi:putative flippase GtrA